MTAGQMRSIMVGGGRGGLDHRVIQRELCIVDWTGDRGAFLATGQGL